MIDKIVTHIDTRLQELGFTVNCGITELVTVTEGTVPAIYSGNGRYKQADLSKDTTYHRMLSFSQDREEDNVSGCEVDIIRSYSMRVVAFFSRKENPYDLYESLMTTMEQSNDVEIANTLGMQYVCLEANALIHGSEAWAGEFSGIQYDLKGDLYVCAIDYLITVRAARSKFTICDG